MVGLNKIVSPPLDDKWWRIQNLYPIIDKTGKIIPFKMNKHQYRVAEALTENIMRQDFSPISVLKARQVGISTFFCIWFLDDVLTFYGKNAIVQSYKHESKDVIFRVISTAYNFMWDQYKIRQDEDPDDKASADSIYIPSKNSRIESKISVRSQAVNMMLYSEYALMKWENIIATLGSVTPHCIKAYESTACGKNHFHKFWFEQKEKDITGTHCIFIPWFEHDEYKLMIYVKNSIGDLDEKEQILKDNYGVKENQLLWRRKKREEMSLNDEHNSFEQEYPSNDVECFQASSTNLLDMALIDKLHSQAVKTKPLLRYWMKDKEGENKTLIKIFKKFTQKEIENKKNFFDLYAGVDPAEGIGRDFSVCVLISVDHLQRMEVVATLRGHTDPTAFADHISQFLKNNYSFNTKEGLFLPYVTVERNNHGHAVLALLDPHYYNLYVHSDDRAGFPQTSISRKQIMHNLFNSIRLDRLLINDPVITDELSTLAINASNKKIEAEQGCHDDSVIALALAIQGYFVQYEEHKPAIEQDNDAVQHSQEDVHLHRIDQVFSQIENEF